MNFVVFIDNEKGFRGRVIVQALNKDGNELDREVVLKHPCLLRVRCWLARGRIKRRQRKLAKINKKCACG